jgi:hypothetical protein
LHIWSSQASPIENKRLTFILISYERRLKIMIKNKKGIQLNQAVPAIVTLVLIAVLVIVAIYLFSSLGTSMMTPNTVGSYTNESIGIVNSKTTTPLRMASFTDPVCTVTACRNATVLNTVIPTDNYTASGCTVRYIGQADLQGVNNSAWKCDYTYTYTADTAASNASGTTISNFSAYPALVGLVGTIIFLGIVIGVLVASFVFGNKGV